MVNSGRVRPARSLETQPTHKQPQQLAFPTRRRSDPEQSLLLLATETRRNQKPGHG